MVNLYNCEIIYHDKIVPCIIVYHDKYSTWYSMINHGMHTMVK